MTIPEFEALTYFEKHILGELKKMRDQIEETNELLKTIIAMDEK